MELIPLKSPLIRSGTDLFTLLKKLLTKSGIKEGDVLVVSSKVVSYAEERLVDLDATRTRRRRSPTSPISPFVSPSNRRGYGSAPSGGNSALFAKSPHAPALSDLIQEEADIMIDREAGLTITQGCFIPFAGIDQSNAPKGMAILWPKNPFASAARLQKNLAAHFHLKRLGILIADSTCHPLRRGTGGLAIGWAGFVGVEDERGKKDLYGKKLRITQKAVADNLSSAALLLAGEAAERTPFVIFRGAPVRFTNRKIDPTDALISPDQCLFRSLYPKKITRQ